MKIRRRQIDSAESAVAEAGRKAQEKKEQADRVSHDGGRAGEEQKVELSVAKAILALEDSNVSKVEKYKELYAAGELGFSGTQVAESVAKGIDEAILFSRLAGESDDQ